MGLNIIVLFLLGLAVLQVSVLAWTKVRDERMAGLEMRIVNEGIAHDDEYWFFSNQHLLYRTSAWPIVINLENLHAIPDDLRELSYDHIGDMDVLDGVIYGGLEGGSKGMLAAWNSTDLTFMRSKVTDMKGLPWVAVDPKTKLIYAAEWNECCFLQIYDTVTFEYVRDLPIANGVVLPGEIQGGAFYEGDLYLCTNQQDAIYKVNITTGELEFVLSDVFPKHEYEMEGMDFWDLQSKGLGVMHMFGNFMQIREKSISSYKP